MEHRRRPRVGGGVTWRWCEAHGAAREETVVIPLGDIQTADRGRVGGKALHLASLARRGLPVPEGLVVPTDTFVSVLQAVGLLEVARRASVQLESADVRALREALDAMVLPATLERELVAAARRLGPRLAVRSSAVDEDGRERSFAGQHLTLLNLRPEEVPGALVRCWASLYAEPALAYRGRGPGPGAMAVLVQRMVDASVSGVMFTVNPLSGSWREMTVESTWGLCEGIVSGQVTPHWFLVRRPRRAPRAVQRVLSRVRLNLVHKDLPEIPEQWVADHRGRVGRQRVPLRQRGRPTLDRSSLFRVCRLGLQVESLMGEPQDVEWALDEAGRLHLLQARPITTSGPPRGRADVLWTRRFIGERWPEPATPLGWSLMQPVFEWFVAYPRTQKRYLGGGPAVRLVRSRPYLNVTVFRHLAFKLPGAPPPRFMLEFFPPEEEALWHRRFAVYPDLAVYASLLGETLAERRWRRFEWNPLTNHRAWDAFRRRMDSELPPLCRDPVSDQDAVRLVAAQEGLVRQYIRIHLISLLYANLFYQLLEATLNALVPEQAARLMEALATSPPGNLTLATNASLWELAAVAPEEDLAALERGQRPDPDSPFGRALERVLREYGHRSHASWEIFSPRWQEAPERLVPLLRAHRSGCAEDPTARAERQLLRFQHALTELRSRLSGQGWTGLAELLVGTTRRYLLLRENQRFWFDHLLFAMKRTLLWLGARFVEQGWLEEPDDVAYLVWEEVVGLVEGTLSPEPAREWVARRRARRDADAQTEPPVFLRGDEAVEEQPPGSRMQGLGISPGRVRGRVRVVRTLADGHRLEPGEVLVTRAVDPAWTPLFLQAGGVILEMGSRLSHGAVVAREYELPAVVNLDGITRTLRDGQEVTVDGTRGVVWIHP